MKAVNVNDILQILYKYGKFIFITDGKKYSDMVDEIANLKAWGKPCDDAVSRQAVLDTLDKMDKALDTDRTVENYKKLLIECYKDLPFVIPKEKTGHWILQPRYEGDDQPNLVCPNCGFKISWWDIGNFCAKCGKELEGGAESDS